MTDPRINLKNPWLAGVLAFLLPGAGHFYQGRNFKGVLYLVCILGTFGYGMVLGEWRPVYWTENAGRVKFGRPAKRNFGFLAQAGMGAPAAFAYLQSRRYHSPGNAPASINYDEENDHDLTEDERNRTLPLRETIDADFSGDLLVRKEDEQKNWYLVNQPVRGRIHLEPHNGAFRGAFEGIMLDESGKEQTVSLKLGGTLFVDSRVLGEPNRAVWAGVLPVEGNFKALRGAVPRGVMNWLSAPQDNSVLHDLNGRLNKRFEMALVFTWIAGLLNVLAIWDAMQGPAYGYGDEPPPEKDEPEKSASDQENPIPPKVADDKSVGQPGNGGTKEQLAEPVGTDPASLKGKS